MRERERSTRVVFIRHGETDFPTDRIYCDDREDPALNARGLAQVRAASDCLANVQFSALYASPSLRTRMTSEAVLAFHNSVEAVFDDRLRERHFGVWEGLYFNEIERDFPEDYAEWKQDQAAFKPTGGESVYDLAERVVPAVREFVEINNGKTVVVVAHVGPIRVMVANALGLPIELYRQMQVDPASITVVDYGRFQNNLILLNDHSRHWGA